MQTSYAIIANYKQRLTNLDRAIYGPPLRHTHPQPHPHNQNAQPPPVVEHKRLLQRFRQFLAEEEKFWTQLVLRLRRNFAVEDAQPALVALGLSQDGDPQQQQDHSPNNNNNNRRNPFQFPPDSDTPNDSLLPSSVAQRESRLAIVCKAIVCLGDIARYKELYNESGGRPRAGHEDGQSAILSVKASRGKRASAHANHTQTSRSRDYSKAQKCYEEARLLIPSDGNPSHQLAIISSYQKDIFNSLFHYYRALCVKQPYDTASENLGSILRKQLSVWRSVGVKKERERDEKERMGLLEEDRRPPIFRVDEFKDKLAVVHAQWRFGDHE